MIIKENPAEFDLVVTDHTMPEMTGIELAAELLKVRPNTPIILCSGQNAQVSEEYAKALGIRGFYIKPLEINQFSKAIRRVLT